MAETPQIRDEGPIKSELKIQPFYDLEILVGDSFSTFTTLETAVCTHGLFLMAPNTWDPLTKTLLRPLRLPSSASSVVVRVSHSPGEPFLLVRVHGRAALSAAEREAVEAQVRRMLRLSEAEERKVRGFQELHAEAKEKGFGRVFRSPTLFEDMVKVILFCNCQWPRTLSMARALCDLQLELQQSQPHSSDILVNGRNALCDEKSKVVANGPETFTPATPATKESRRKRKAETVLNSISQADRIQDSIGDSNAGKYFGTDCGIELEDSFNMTSVSLLGSEDGNKPIILPVAVNTNPGPFATEMMGNFPSPEEIASLDEKYLAKRCGLGYRAGRILKLARGVLEGRVQLNQLEELCDETSLSNYEKVEEKLREIEGYGPFTRGNVLMCMGFYNVIPSDSETIRHLKQVHAKTTTIQKVQNVVEEMYWKYEPYQFLAYWFEIWNFYEGWFGKFSEMPPSDYKLITATNMKPMRGKPKEK